MWHTSPTPDTQTKTPEEALAHLETALRAWQTQAATLYDYTRAFLTLMKLVDTNPDALASVRQRACELGLTMVAYAMSTERGLTLTFMRSLATVLQHSDWRALIADESHRYALLDCVVTAIYFGLSQEEIHGWNMIFAEWLPLTTDIQLTCTDDMTLVAKKVLHPVWQTLYDIDFTTMGLDELHALFATHPPLASTAYTPPVVEVVRPSTLTAE